MSTQLILPEGVDKLTLPQKVLALGATGLVAWYVLPILLTMMVNLLMVVVIGAALAFAAYNYRAIFWLAGSLTNYLTDWVIGLDVLGAMDRYLLWYREQKNILLAGKSELETSVLGTKEDIAKAEKSYQKNLSNGDNAEKMGMMAQAEVFLSNAQMDKEYITDLLPLVKEGEEQLQFMNELAEAVGINEQKLAYSIKTQKDKFKNAKAMQKGLGAAARASQGINGNEMWRRTNEQLVNQMNKMTSDINRYKEVLKPAIEQNRFDKQLRQTEGMKLLQEFRNGGKQLSSITGKN